MELNNSKDKQKRKEMLDILFSQIIITLAMASFSSATYPDTSITSIRSFNGSGIVSNTLAVHINKT